MLAYFKDNPGIITAVDFTGFKRIDQIYSGSDKFGQILMEGYITDAESRSFFDPEVFKDFNKWDTEIWIVKMGLAIDGAFLKYYFNEIKKGSSRRARPG